MRKLILIGLLAFGLCLPAKAAIVTVSMVFKDSEGAAVGSGSYSYDDAALLDLTTLCDLACDGVTAFLPSNIFISLYNSGFSGGGGSRVEFGSKLLGGPTGEFYQVGQIQGRTILNSQWDFGSGGPALLAIFGGIWNANGMLGDGDPFFASGNIEFSIETPLPGAFWLMIAGLGLIGRKAFKPAK